MMATRRNSPRVRFLKSRVKIPSLSLQSIDNRPRSTVRQSERQLARYGKRSLWFYVGGVRSSTRLCSTIRAPLTQPDTAVGKFSLNQTDECDGECEDRRRARERFVAAGSQMDENLLLKKGHATLKDTTWYNRIQDIELLSSSMSLSGALYSVAHSSPLSPSLGSETWRPVSSVKGAM
jgi:hypothetical protein